MRAKQLLLVLAVAGGVSACGGGSSGSVAGIDGGGALPPPVATAVATQGRITGFGSIIVNGVRYDTSSANITIDDEPGSESDLAVGQVVTILGTINADGRTGVAASVEFDDVVEGPIESIDVTGGSMVVLKQTVVVDGDTAFDDGISPKSLEGLAVDDVVEVSGYRRADGTIVATHIEREDSPDGFETTGFVENVDAAAMTFDIAGLVVDYSSAMLEGFASGMPENGQRVEVEGQVLGASGELIATEVELEDFDFDDQDGEVEIEGLITRFASPTDFDVNGIPVTTTASTQFEYGSSADLALDRRVEVEGSFNDSGILVAREVEFENEGTVRVGGTVEATGASQITVLGLVFLVNSGTEFEDDSELDLPTFSFADVDVGDYVEVRAYEDGSDLIATRLERDDNPGTVFVRGVVDSVSDPDFTILGVTVQTHGQTEFEDANELPISPATFFAEAEGRLVEAEGANVNGAIVAEKVEFEN